MNYQFKVISIEKTLELYDPEEPHLRAKDGTLLKQESYPALNGARWIEDTFGVMQFEWLSIKYRRLGSSLQYVPETWTGADAVWNEVLDAIETGLKEMLSNALIVAKQSLQNPNFEDSEMEAFQDRKGVSQNERDELTDVLITDIEFSWIPYLEELSNSALIEVIAGLTCLRGKYKIHQELYDTAFSDPWKTILRLYFTDQIYDSLLNRNSENLLAKYSDLRT
ncbi:MAG: hypothetical protein HOJ88_12175, partial [Proteobacteria bacterium]|nr:hypothetical protein [Pseudomonadota bacterium]